jgi:anti-sigma28 factor (negative regulator of flagellin synthesis)
MNTSGIRSAGLSTAGGAQSGRAPAAIPSGEASASAAPVRSDSLDFISAVAAAPPPVDARAVRMIHDLIASGSYPITPAKIAAAMISVDLRR